MEQGIRQKGRLSVRGRNFMFYAGIMMLCVFYYVSWRYMASEEFLAHCLALSISTVMGTVVGYFLVRDNVSVLIVWRAVPRFC